MIDRIKDKTLLNQSFFDKAVMILKIDGSNNELFVLANESIIPDLDVKRHLRLLTYIKFNVITGQLKNGRTLEIHRNNREPHPEIGMKITIDGYEPEDGKYKSESTGRNYEIRNGKIHRTTQPINYKTTNDQKLTIEQVYSYSISVEDLVYVDNELAKTGKYKLSSLSAITILIGGSIKKTIF